MRLIDIVIEAESGEAVEYLSSMYAYSLEEYEDLFRQAGFALVEKPDAAAWPVGEVFTGKIMPFVWRKS